MNGEALVRDLNRRAAIQYLEIIREIRGCSPVTRASPFQQLVDETYRCPRTTSGFKPGAFRYFGV